MYRFLLLLFLTVSGLALNAQDSSLTHKEVIYGRKDGMALTLLVQPPVQPANNRAVINLVSGNWVSGITKSTGYLKRGKVFADRGYTVFTVMTSSQPRYNILDEIADVKRAIRFVRYHASEYGIDPQKIGIVGSSSGGHLSLMASTASDTTILSFDPVDRVSSRVQAAGVFFPPTDFLNYGHQGYNAQANEMFITMARLGGAFDFKELNNKTGLYESITDSTKRRMLAGEISPVYQVSADDPPTLIIHGDNDYLVPIQQSEEMISALEKVHVPCKLIVKHGGGHGWLHMNVEEEQIVNWFDQYLK